MNTSSRTLASVIVCFAGAAAAVQAQTLAPTYRARVLGELARTNQAGITEATAISANGLAVGYTWEYGRPSRGWAWDGTAAWTLEPPSSMAGAWTYAHAVNAQGVVAGAVELEGRSYGAVWRGGEVSLLDPINPGESAAAAAINDFGLVTGGSWPGGIVWRNGGAEGASSLRLIDGAATGSAFLVNNSGTFAGYGAKPGERAHPARWSENGGGEWLALPSEPAGAQDFVGTQVTGMNQRGDVIGWTTSYGFTGSGQLWRAGDEQLVEIGRYDPANPGLVVPAGINDNAWVVGFRDVPGAGRGAFLWIEGEMFDVAGLLDPAAGAITLLSADGINNDGVIVGTALVNDRIVPVLLTPVPSPGGLGVLGVTAALLAARRHR